MGVTLHRNASAGTGLTSLNEYAGARTGEVLNALKLIPPIPQGESFLIAQMDECICT